MTDTALYISPDDAARGKDECCVVRLTPIGRGGVSCVGVSGSVAVDGLLRRVRRDSGSIVAGSFEEYDRPYFAHFRILEDEEVFEEIVLRRRARSVFEIDCHGGELVTTRIIDYFVQLGARTLPADEWERAVELQESRDSVEDVGNIARASALTRGEVFCRSHALEELFFSEISLALSRVSSEETARIALDQRRALRLFFERLIVDLQKLASSAADEECVRVEQVLDSILTRRSWGRRLFDPFVVAFIGAPNVGKSSLFNALLGYNRSVVSSEEGTTRDLVGASTLLKGWTFRLVDAAGLRETNDQVERDGVEYARRLISDADLVLCCYDASAAKSDQETFWERLSAELSSVATLRVLNKSDLLESQDSERWGSEFVRVSALFQRGLDDLIGLIYQRTVGGLECLANENDAAPILWTQDQRDFLKTLRDLCVERRYNDALAKLNVGGAYSYLRRTERG